MEVLKDLYQTEEQAQISVPRTVGLYQAVTQRAGQ